MDRRTFLQTTSAALALLPQPAWALPPAKPKARVIVIGGGMGGAAVAKYLRLWGDTVAVTLIERQAKYVSSILSSLVLTGQRSLPSLTFGYDALRNRYGVDVVIDEAVEVDPIRTTVRLASGGQLSADRVVMAPGISFDPVPGLNEEGRIVHAWQAGPQTATLAKQLTEMPANGVVVLTIPKPPYRCPPGPYERACLIADWLKTMKPNAKLIVLDANPDIIVEKENFSRAFGDLYAKTIEYRSGIEITSADPRQMALSTNSGSVRGDVINLIPRQRAATLVAATGLVSGGDGRFAPVDVLSYASTVAPTVHVIGDSIATAQPKAGHIANQEAKVCADALLRIFSGQHPDPSPVTNSACYSTITQTEAAWLTAVFQYDSGSKSMVPAAKSFAASNGWTADNFKDMGKWFDALMADTFF
ncbi:FAD-dependent pyridine nucleotide-disulfide oxidoreductase [Hyphomicrobium denitrificans 1NES1]|uniref:FAD-dependent pyridine nucleotide-disulfide oxidoreductase n=1 Tax=Hyphomicrobium denitrificans 1NES1 TaxID=670307 RepID=N0B2C1_9HYPH|nr:FAD/NAD(P)-binding oxidoreductase [Hyphomicrobium denitrificans]AGK57088.1 FAD-dependent pyridine nucleotide-disulfide oxidoreductase [Hyphomicrobium denitrificans 1NES1]